MVEEDLVLAPVITSLAHRPEIYVGPWPFDVIYFHASIFLQSVSESRHLSVIAFLPRASRKHDEQEGRPCLYAKPLTSSLTYSTIS